MWQISHVWFLMQVWVERFREWMSKEVLKRLLAAVDKAHKVTNLQVNVHL